VAVEHYAVDKPSTSIFAGTAGLTPDPLNYGWRDYGMRVGIWRMIESLDRHGMRATAFVNSDACSLYPQVIAAGNERNWSWVAHGRDNSTFQNGMEKSVERKYLEEVVDEIERHTGTRPTGWIGPALTETFETPQILAELGLEYVLDWCADDQPFYLNGEKPMLSVPYSTVLNDVMLFGGNGLSGEGFVQLIKDQYEQLSKEADDHVRVMGIGLHPFIINQPFRQKYLDLALDFIAEQDDVWITTSDDIAAHFKNNVADRPAA
ncbi:polysaccharide deacetylase family protein, partial [Rhodococcus phenolicus]|uniref:polysaccharide deacetylase family protein n=1 Tax=Rhodococcus phenolicus TaxID=263849 RepID=UPI000A73BD08